jgi:hypothetical protein
MNRGSLEPLLSSKTISTHKHTAGYTPCVGGKSLYESCKRSLLSPESVERRFEEIPTDEREREERFIIDISIRRFRVIDIQGFEYGC